MEPRTATQHAAFTFFCTLRINHVILWIITVPVLTPLPHIAVHVMKPRSIRWETADWRGFLPTNPFLTVAIGEIAIVIRLLGRNRVAKVKRRFRTRAAAKFPFRFSRQAIRLLIFFPQLLDDLLAIPPRNLVHWQALLALEMSGVVSHHGLPLFLRDEMNRHVETLA